MSKAIVFTHQPIRMKSLGETYNPDSRDELIQRVLPYYKAYLQCKNIRLIYVYVDTGLQLAFQHFGEQGSKLSFSIEEVEFEQNTRNCLKLAVDKAVFELMNDKSANFNPMEAPQFQFVGLPHLSSLIRTLYRNNQELFKSLAGAGGKFTYDSPKFVDAVIRLSIRDEYPVLRFDADVKVNEQGINEILEAISRIPRGQYSFFSGGYGTYGPWLDPVNDFAVRLHWLVDKKIYNDGLLKNDPVLKMKSLSDLNKKFLRDLGEVGATQIPSNQQLTITPSPEMVDYIIRERSGSSINRMQQQVISGAGLYMNYQTIFRLPPFMNFTYLTLWVDDHLKRQLHEALNDLSARDLEHIDTALFVQDRHPEGLKEPKTHEEIFASKKNDQIYFERLLRGCILSTLIRKPDRTIGVLGSVINTTIETGNEYIFSTQMKQDWITEAGKAAEAILDVWKNADYGNLTLTNWAQSAFPTIPSIVESLVEDAIEYVRVVHLWPQFEVAITGLHDYQAYWLKRDLDSGNNSIVV